MITDGLSPLLARQAPTLPAVTPNELCTLSAMNADSTPAARTAAQDADINRADGLVYITYSPH